MKIKISTASPDTLNRDMLILGFFSDERPPRGYCGLVDWRLNGMISTEIARGRLSGVFMEKLLYAFPKRIRISRILLFGLGSLCELTYDRLYNAGYEMAMTVSGILADDLALPIPAANRGLKLSGMAEALITGLFDGFSCKPGELPSILLEIPAKADQVDEIRSGLDLFQRRVGSAGCEILPMEVTGDGQSAVRKG
ncbi:MAG: hypothetical protein JXL20_08565 [Deltaproteobacteria bacterium]|nr:hypothetical protein [Deltaproteobacteria bacterium]